MNYQTHEYANLFPMMDAQAFAELKADIQENGLLEPVVLYQERILDGRNRYKACSELGIEPRFETVNGHTDPLKYVISKNLKRRHLNETQRGLVSARLADMKRGRQSNSSIELFSQPAAADLLNVSVSTLKRVKSVMEQAPDLIPAMESGDMAAHEAQRIVDVRKRQKERAQMSDSARFIPVPDLVSGFYFGDLREEGKRIESNSVDLILTDPPYPVEFIDCWSALAELASRVLKPSGFLVAYSGQLNLPGVMSRLSEHLIYYWINCLSHSGVNQLIMPRNIFCGWKPILVYQKPPFKRLDDKFSDVIIGSGREKGLHDWQQGEQELNEIIETFTMPGELVLDPFAGGGTTLAACVRKKRRVIGIEIDETSYLLTKGRLSNVIQE